MTALLSAFLAFLSYAGIFGEQPGFVAGEIVPCSTPIDTSGDSDSTLGQDQGLKRISNGF